MNQRLYGVLSTAVMLAASVGLEGATSALPPVNPQDSTVVRNGSDQLRLEFTSQEVRLKDNKGTVALRLLGYGYGDQLRSPGWAKPTAASNRLEYRRGELIEWYVNKAEGVEQGFTLARRPGIARPGDPLVITLGVSGLEPELSSARDTVLLQSHGQDVFRYAGLRSWDARGREVPSRLEVQNREIRLIVDDRSAEYPLVVDPVATPTSFDMASGSPDAVGTNPESIVEADFNKDGIPDLAIANGGGFVSVLLGNGDGTFTSSSASAGAGPKAIEMGDFNNDGCPDVAIVNSFTGVSVILNSSSPCYRSGFRFPFVTYTAGSEPEAVAVGNFTSNTFNGLPCQDMAVTNYNDNTVSIFINKCDGTGTFNPPFTLPTGTGPVGVQIADFNNDGNNDVAIVDSVGEMLTVYLGNGLGAFSLGGNFSILPPSVSSLRTLNLGQTLARGDFNHDGYLDVAIATSAGVVVLLNSALTAPSVGFGPPNLYPAHYFPSGIRVGDFNQDGILDLVVSNANSNDMSVLLGNGTGGIGNGTFAPPVNFPVGTLPTSLAVGEFNINNNNYQGVAVTNYGDTPGDVTVYLGTVWTIAPIIGNNQGALLGAQFKIPLEVQVTDAGPPITHVAGATVTFTAPVSGAGATFSPTPAPLTNASGETEVTATANDVAGTYNVTVTAGFAASTTFTLTNFGQDSITPYAGTPQSTTAGTPFPIPLQALVTDAFGNPIVGESVTFSITPAISGASAAFLTPFATSTASNGVASVSLQANGIAGTYTVTATAAGIGSATFVLTNLGPPALINIVSGTGQTTAVNTNFPAPLVAKVTDAAGDPLPNVTVTFTFQTGPGGASATFPGGITTAFEPTNSSGIATSPVLTANGFGGSFTATASAPGTNTVTYNLTNSTSGIIIPTVTVQAGSWTPLAVSLGAPAATTIYVTLTSNNTSVASMNPVNAQSPTTIIFLAGSTTPTFEPKVYGIADGSTTITATAYGYPASTGLVDVIN